MVHHLQESIATLSLCTASIVTAYYALTKGTHTTPLTIEEEADPLAAISFVGGIATMKLHHATIMLVSLVSATLGQEFIARYFHRLKHNQSYPDFELHASHHKPKSSNRFEANDVLIVKYTIFLIGPFFWSATAEPVTCGTAAMFGICVGIVLYGICFKTVHDGIYHQRFPVWGLDHIPWIQRVVEAHNHHHTSQQGAPLGLFLGPQEVEAERAGLPPPQMPWVIRISLVTSCCIAASGVLLGY